MKGFGFISTGLHNFSIAYRRVRYIEYIDGASGLYELVYITFQVLSGFRLALPMQKIEGATDGSCKDRFMLLLPKEYIVLRRPEYEWQYGFLRIIKETDLIDLQPS